jgi:hypothetical protein
VVFDQAGSDDFLSLKTAQHRQGLKLHHACSFSEGKYFFSLLERKKTTHCVANYITLFIKFIEFGGDFFCMF